MRVLVLSKTGEGARWAIRACRRLIDLGWDVHVAVPEGSLTHYYTSGGATVHAMAVGLSHDPVKTSRRMSALRRLVADVSPDVIHSWFVTTTISARLALGKNHPIPRVFQVPGPLHLESPLFRRAEIMTAGPRDSWIATCRWVHRMYLACGIHPERLWLSYLGTDLSEFEPRRPGRLRIELELDNRIRIIGMVAQFYRPKRYLGQTRGLKGHEDLLDAYSLVRSTHPDTHLAVVGGPWGKAERYMQRVQRRATAMFDSGVSFLGFRRDIADLYADFNVAVHPSHSENLGGAAESLLLGVPTVATNVGGFPDIVVPGDTGWLVPPRSPEALARAIREVLDDPGEAHRRANRGRERARQLLDVTKTAEEVSQALTAAVRSAAGA